MHGSHSAEGHFLSLRSPLDGLAVGGRRGSGYRRQRILESPRCCWARHSDSQAAPKTEERRVRLDSNSAGVQVTQFRQQVCWQMGENMLFDVPADQLRDLRPPPFRQGIERIVWLFVLGIRRGHSLRPPSKTCKPMLAQATDR